MLRPGQPDAFELPLLPVQRLMRFSLGATHQHRVRTGGVVTRCFSDTMLFVRNGDAGLQVVTQEPHGLRTGDRIDAVGFPGMVEGMAVLQHALCRVTGREAPPVPVRPTIGTLLEGTYNSDLVTVAARLVDWVITGRNVTLIFQSGDHLFKGLLNLPAHASVTLPEKNSLVNVTGISVISELEDLWFYRPTSFVLLVADLADLQVLQAAPWWTPERLWRALAMSCLVLLAAVGWVWALRRQIDGKRALIEQQARHAAALDYAPLPPELVTRAEAALKGLRIEGKPIDVPEGLSGT